MKKQNQSKKPFFSIFLESQMEKIQEEHLQGGEENVTHKYPSDAEDNPPVVTHKYPSDAEDAYTKKFPTDSDEVTMAYPSDSDHEGSPI